MGRDGTQRVLDNLNTRIWFRLTDDATAKLAVEGLGMTSGEPRGHIAQPELRGTAVAHRRGSRGRHAVRGPFAGSPGMGNGTAARRGLRADAGRELEAAGAAVAGRWKKKEHRRGRRTAYGLVGVLAELKGQVRPVKKEVGGDPYGSRQPPAAGVRGRSTWWLGCRTRRQAVLKSQPRANGKSSSAILRRFGLVEPVLQERRDRNGSRKRLDGGGGAGSL